MAGVYLLRIEWDSARANLDDLIAAASPRRRVRCQRYRRDVDVIRCLLAECLLFHALATRGVIASDHDLETAPGGKPHLRDPRLHFNLSHAGDWVVCALSDYPVGIDVEDLRNDVSTQDIAAHFSVLERDFIAAGRPRSRQRAYRMWTLKESWRKYVGDGLRGDLATEPIRVTGPETASLEAPPPSEPRVMFTSRWLDDSHVFSLCSQCRAGEPEAAMIASSDLPV